MVKGDRILCVIAILCLVFIVSGCAVGFYKGRPSDKAKIRERDVKISELKDELARLREAKTILESRLRSEIDAKQVKLDMAERGLVITFMAEILFDSGKAKIKSEGAKILEKIGRVIREEGITNDIGIEGHTDNEPIKYSGYKSNWELSTARATSVLHYLDDSCRLSPERMSATGYGEYRPVVSNDTPQGRRENRRVEIVIKPEELTEAQKRKASREDEYIK